MIYTLEINGISSITSTLMKSVNKISKEKKNKRHIHTRINQTRSICEKKNVVNSYEQKMHFFPTFSNDILFALIDFFINTTSYSLVVHPDVD